MVSRRIASALCAGASLVAGCADPVLQEQIDALGPETPGVPEGPLHRPGQPCVTCHREGSIAEPFSVAGTIYQYEDEAVPLRDALVTLRDSEGRGHVTATNCVGNFFVLPGDFRPAYPISVSVAFGDSEARMTSLIYREGSCAQCHAEPAGAQSVGHVYFLPTRGVPPGFELPPPVCP